MGPDRIRGKGGGFRAAIKKEAGGGKWERARAVIGSRNRGGRGAVETGGTGTRGGFKKWSPGISIGRPWGGVVGGGGGERIGSFHLNVDDTGDCSAPGGKFPTKRGEKLNS